jgi:hypothetical protein
MKLIMYIHILPTLRICRDLWPKFPYTLTTRDYAIRKTGHFIISKALVDFTLVAVSDCGKGGEVKSCKGGKGGGEGISEPPSSGFSRVNSQSFPSTRQGNSWHYIVLQRN